MWGFLTEFWDAITGVGEYTIEFFENIGLAVAGAIGNLFNYIIHYTNDFFIFLSWVFSALKELTLAITLPLSYIFTFLRGFIINSTQEPIIPEVSYKFTTSTMEIFETIPYWTTISITLGVGILIIGGIGILMLILKI